MPSFLSCGRSGSYRSLLGTANCCLLGGNGNRAATDDGSRFGSRLTWSAQGGFLVVSPVNLLSLSPTGVRARLEERAWGAGLIVHTKKEKEQNWALGLFALNVGNRDTLQFIKFLYKIAHTASGSLTTAKILPTGFTRDWALKSPMECIHLALFLRAVGVVSHVLLRKACPYCFVRMFNHSQNLVKRLRSWSNVEVSGGINILSFFLRKVGVVSHVLLKKPSFPHKELFLFTVQQ